MTYERPHGKTNNLHRRKQRCRSASLISTFVFATRIVKFLYFLNPKFVSGMAGTQIVSFLTHRLV